MWKVTCTVQGDINDFIERLSQIGGDDIETEEVEE